jgi:hypothetical protein
MPGTVLLLGSGASRASQFALPTMAGFFTGAQSLPSNLDDFLSWFYPGRTRDSYNLEEVLAYLDISRARLPLWGLRDPTQQFDKEELTHLCLSMSRHGWPFLPTGSALYISSWSPHSKREIRSSP